MTNAIIDRLQNYYGIAVRQNVGDLQGMTKAIHSTLFHVASSKQNNYHVQCPVGKSSWCRYQKDIACRTTTYKPGPGLPLSVIQHVKPIYNDLSKNELLEKCLHGKTQNQNESFNGMIWERLPKTKYVSSVQLKFGVYDAVSNFNIGRKASVLTFEKLNMIPGRYMDSVKTRRKILRGKKKKKDDHDIEVEGPSYEAGGY